MSSTFFVIAILLASGEAQASTAVWSVQSGPHADREAISDVLSLYSHHLDSFNLDAWFALFTEDIQWEVFVGEDLVSKLDGRNAIEEFYRPRMTQFKKDGIQRRHVITNSVIVELTDKRARVDAYLTLLSVAQRRELSIASTGEYEGELVKQDGRWLISHWVIRLDRPL